MCVCVCVCCVCVVCVTERHDWCPLRLTGRLEALALLARDPEGFEADAKISLSENMARFLAYLERRRTDNRASERAPTSSISTFSSDYDGIEQLVDNGESSAAVEAYLEHMERKKRRSLARGNRERCKEGDSESSFRYSDSGPEYAIENAPFLTEKQRRMWPVSAEEILNVSRDSGGEKFMVTTNPILQLLDPLLHQGADVCMPTYTHVC